MRTWATRHRAGPIALAAIMLLGCTDDDSAAPATNGATAQPTDTSSTVAANPPHVEATIEVESGQLLGLAIDEHSVWPVSFDAGRIFQINPADNAVVTMIELGAGAASALAVDGDVWVAGYGSTYSALYRVDAASASLAATYAVTELCCDLSSGDGSLWAVDPAGSALQIDLITGATVQILPVGIDRNAHTNAVWSDGFLWYSSDTTPLARLDPLTGTAEEFDVGGGVPFLVRDGLVWGASATKVWAVDGTGTVVETIELQRTIEVLSLELHGDDVWVGVRHPRRVGAVQQIQRSTGTVLAELEIEIPARMVVGFGSLWVTDSGSDQLYRIGPLG